MPAESLTQVVDENDRPIGIKTRRDIQTEGLWHRVVGVWLVDAASNDILLQIRLNGRGLDDGKINSSASGHVDPGESYEQAAIRETKEELGVSISDEQLEQIAYFKTQSINHEKVLNRFVKVFRVRLARQALQSVTLREDELEGVQIFSEQAFQTLIRDTPERTVPGVVIAHYIATGTPLPGSVVSDNNVVVL